MATQRDIVNRQIAAQEFWERINSLIGNERPYTWADRHGITRSTFQAARQRGNRPLRSTTDAWAKKIGCDPDWLATGEGQPNTAMQERTAPEGIETITNFPQPAKVDVGLLSLAIETVEQILADTRRKVSPEKRARLIAAVYALYSDSPDPSKVQDNVVELIRSAA